MPDAPRPARWEVPPVGEAVAATRRFDLRGKGALLLVPSSECAFAVADAVSRAGARVAVALPGNSAVARSVAGRVPGTVALELDHLDDATVPRLIERAGRELGGLDIVVIEVAAGTPAPLVDADDRAWAQGMIDPLTGAWRVIRAAGRAMVRQGYGGRIVVILPPLDGNAGTGALMRRSLTSLVESSAVELARHDVTVNGIAPGLVQDGPEGPTRESLGRVPKGRAGQAADVAPLVVFLASDEADYLAGSLIPVDGGRRLN